MEIKAIAREAGSRTKMAVVSNDPSVDPVGACVGRNGERVKTIVNELGNEQIDIITWDENPAQLIVNALSPAKVVSIIADEDEKKAQLVVSDKQLSLAIGKAGQNVRLAAKLTGYGIDIKSESQAEDFTEMADDDQYTEPDEDADETEDVQEAQVSEEIIDNEPDEEEPDVQSEEDTDEEQAGNPEEDKELEDESEERKDEQ